MAGLQTTTRTSAAQRSTTERALALSALLFAAAALYHLLAALTPALGIPGVRWRHLLFVGIDGVIAVHLLRRPRWLVFPLSALTLYSLYSHGMGAWHLWHAERRVDWLSLGVVVVLPAILGTVIMHRASQKPSRSYSSYSSYS